MPFIDSRIISVFHGLFAVEVIVQHRVCVLDSALSSLVFFISRLERLICASNVAFKFSNLLSCCSNGFRASFKDLTVISNYHRNQHRVTNPFLFFDLSPGKLHSKGPNPI